MHQHPHDLPTPLPPTTTPHGSHSSTPPPLTPTALHPHPLPWWRSRCLKCITQPGKPNAFLRPPQQLHQVHSLQAPVLGPSPSSALCTPPPSPSNPFQTTQFSRQNSLQSHFPPLKQSQPSPSKTPLFKKRTMITRRS